MKINILGWYDRNNAGDEAFKLAFNELFPDCEKVYTTDHIDETADRLILGGGDVIKEYYLKRIPNNKPFHIIGAGLGYESEIELLKEKNIRSIYLRNLKDLDLGKKIGREFKYTPDLTFLIPSSQIPKNKGPHEGRKILGVILTDHINPSHGRREPKDLAYTEFFKWELAETLDYLSEWYEIRFIPMSKDEYSDDIKICSDIRARMKYASKASIIGKYNSSVDPLIIIEEISKCNLIISMKFHGLIFSILTNTPVVNIGITRKTNLLLQEMGLSGLTLEPYTFTKDRLLKNVKIAEDSKLLPMLDKEDYQKEILKIKEQIMRDVLTN